jgi:hypothetical protein
MRNLPPRYDRLLVCLLVMATTALVATIVIVTGTTSGLTDLASFILSVSAVAATMATTKRGDSRSPDRGRNSRLRR